MDAERARTLLEACRGKLVLVIGDVMLDTYVEGTIDRLNPELPAAPLLSVRSERHATGGAGNAAKNLAALRAEVALFGAVGNDAAASLFEWVAAEEGYEVRLIHVLSSTTVKTRYLCEGRQLMRADRDTVAVLSPSERERLLIHLASNIQSSAAVLISDYGKGLMTPALVADLVKMTHEAKALCFIDPKPALGRSITGADSISPNLSEARLLLGIAPTEESPPFSELARELAARYETNVFLTLGGAGIQVCSKDGENLAVPQMHRVAVADTSGCGDTAAAMILLATLAGATQKEAAELGNAAGAVVASHVGAVACTPEQVLAMLASASTP